MHDFHIMENNNSVIRIYGLVIFSKEDQSSFERGSLICNFKVDILIRYTIIILSLRNNWFSG